MSLPDRIEVRGPMAAANTMQLFKLLEADGAAVRFVGGCVRDAVLGRYEACDVDLATDAHPDRVVRLLRRAGLPVAHPGLDHGTVMAIFPGQTVEITTLRRDVATDGRRARVAFTDDWSLDASRRDFTMNGLFADRSGRIYDYVGGRADLRDQRVRFIGSAADRIVEDHLRILRYFRFQASHGTPPPDHDAMEACTALAHCVKTLPGERIWNELAQLFVADNAVEVLGLMEEASVLGHLLPVPRDLDKARRMKELEHLSGVGADPVRGLASLLGPDEEETGRLARRLRLTRADSRRLVHLAAREPGIRPDLETKDMSALLYRLGSKQFCDRVLLEAAAQGGGSRWVPICQNLMAKAEGWVRPDFPVDGRDIMNLGVHRGPEIGALLSTVETWWIDRSFQPDRSACLEHLQTLLGRNDVKPASEAFRHRPPNS